MPKRNEVFITAAIPRELRKELVAYSAATGLKLKFVISFFLSDGLKRCSVTDPEDTKRLALAAKQEGE